MKRQLFRPRAAVALRPRSDDRIGKVELLRRRAASVTNLEISTNYEGDARRLLEGLG